MADSKVLVATDFSADSELALEQARAHARLTNAAVLLVHVLHRPSQDEGEGMLHEGAYADPSAALTERLKETAEGVRDVACEYALLRGDPAEAILRIADKEGVAMIVMGTHGRSGVFRVLMGSVAEEVIRKAACPVMIVKRPRAAAE